MREIEKVLIQADLDYHKLEKDGSGDLEEWSSFVSHAIEQRFHLIPITPGMIDADLGSGL